jgi:hypothetical protein
MVQKYRNHSISTKLNTTNFTHGRKNPPTLYICGKKIIYLFDVHICIHT